MLQWLGILPKLLIIMSKPKVSVCMIVYNHAKYIEEAIQGVMMQQTNFDVEFIIANDASTDQTNGIISNLNDINNESIKIKYINHSKNIGMMPNFIFTLKECKGEYTALCEGDDYWTDPLKLQKQVDFLERNKEYAGCFHNTLFTNDNEFPIKFEPWRIFTKDIFNFKDTISVRALFHTSSFVFRSNLLNIPSWFVKVKSGDMALFSLIASKGLLYRIDEDMSVYRMNDNGVTNFITKIDYHKMRIKLQKYLRSTFSEENDTMNQVAKYHKSELYKLEKNIFERIKIYLQY